MFRTIIRSMIYFCWSCCGKKREGAAAGLKPVIYNYITYDEEANGYLFMIFTNFNVFLDYGCVNVAEVTRDELVHILQESPKPLYFKAFGPRYDIVTVVEGEGEYPPGFDEARKGVSESLPRENKFQLYYGKVKGWLSGVCKRPGQAKAVC